MLVKAASQRRARTTKHAPASSANGHVRLTRLRPLGERVVIKPIPREEMTKSGIVIPDTVKEKPQEGMVVATGRGRVLDDGTRVPMDVKEGQKVLYAKYSGTEFKIDGDDLLIVSQKDILATVRH
jgi:chaperonin GroES